MNTKAHTLAALTAMAIASIAGAEVVNGGFETGDFSGWETLPTGDSIFEISSDSFSGSSAAYFRNDTQASSAVLKQTGIGAGDIEAGVMVNVQFTAKGSAGVGGVFFAELFSVDAAGGVTQSQILGGAPIFFSSEYQTYSFDVLAGPDVAGGLTIQFGAVTGAVEGSYSEAFIDDVIITYVPAPGAMALMGLGGLAAVRRRR